MDAEFQLQSFVLGCPRFKGKHEAEKIFNLTASLLDEYGMRQKVYYVAVDNGANMLKTFREMQQPTDSDDDTDWENEYEDDAEGQRKRMPI